MPTPETAYMVGCLSILMQEDKDQATRNLGVQAMVVAEKKLRPTVLQAFSAGRYAMAVDLSKRRSKLLKK